MGSEHAPLLEPLVMDFMVVTFDRQPGMKLPVLLAEATKAGGKLNKEKVMNVLHQIGKAANCKQPFTIMWDARYLRAMPRPSHVNAAIEWAKDKTVAKLLDEHVQGVVVVLNSRVLRTITYFLFKVLRPPQPTQVFSDQRAALTFLAERCQSVKAWTPLEERLAAAAVSDQPTGSPTANEIMEQERNERVTPVTPSASHGGVEAIGGTAELASTPRKDNGSTLCGALSATGPEEQQPAFFSGSNALNLLVPAAAVALGLLLASPLAGFTFLLGLSSSTATSWRCSSEAHLPGVRARIRLFRGSG